MSHFVIHSATQPSAYCTAIARRGGVSAQPIARRQRAVEPQIFAAQGEHAGRMRHKRIGRVPNLQFPFKPLNHTVVRLFLIVANPNQNQFAIEIL